MEINQKLDLTKIVLLDCMNFGIGEQRKIARQIFLENCFLSYIASKNWCTWVEKFHFYETKCR